jgi:protein-export membrane protein SecD
MKRRMTPSRAATIAFAVAAVGSSLFAPAKAPARMPLRELGGTVLVLQVDAQAAQAQAAEYGLATTPDVIARSIPILRARLEALGVRGGDVHREGMDRIVVEAPGQANSPRLRAVVTDAARLTFQLVDDSYDPGAPNGGPPPPDDALLPNLSRPCESVCRLAVKRHAWITGSMIATAQLGFNRFSKEPVVEFRLDSAGALRFAEATRENVGHRFAIVLDGKVITAPVIESPMLGGQGEINGNFTVETASDLALLLRSRALPAPLMVVEQREKRPPA